jgi:hypothetical protein
MNDEARNTAFRDPSMAERLAVLKQRLADCNYPERGTIQCGQAGSANLVRFAGDDIMACAHVYDERDRLLLGWLAENAPRIIAELEARNTARTAPECSCDSPSAFAHDVACPVNETANLDDAALIAPAAIKENAPPLELAETRNRGSADADRPHYGYWDHTAEHWIRTAEEAEARHAKLGHRISKLYIDGATHQGRDE